MRPYDPTNATLLHPETAQTVFQDGAPPDDVRLAVEAARLAYLRAEVLPDESARLREALGRIGYGNVQAFNHAETDGQGFGAESGDKVLLAFRGTQADIRGALHNSISPDLFTDLQATMTQWPAVPGRLHAGFAQTARGLWDTQVQPWLKTLRPGRELLVCGHSLGAAIATLLARPAQALLQARTTHLVTIGSPRVGDATFAASLQRAQVKLTRIVNCCDGVTEVPIPLPLLAYVHVTETPTYIDRSGRVGDYSARTMDRLKAHADYAASHLGFDNAPSRALADHAPANYIRAFWG